jgi:DNA invertase Pin-like site-specific DNA recombinase
VTTKKCCIYLRCSTAEQTVENQRGEVVQLARARGFEITEVYEENASASGQRRQFDRMMFDAHRGRFNAVICWALDRFGRSMTGNLAALVELDRLGVQVISVREGWLDTTGPARSLLIAVASWVAEQERIRISDRTKAALARLKAKGVHIGRPKARIDLVEAQRLRASGMSLRRVAQRMKVGTSTLHRLLANANALDGRVPKAGVSFQETEAREIGSVA